MAPIDTSGWCGTNGTNGTNVTNSTKGKKGTPRRLLSSWQVDVLDLRDPSVAHQLHQVMQAAQAQEAAWLQLDGSAIDVPSAQDFSASPHCHLGVWSPGGPLLGACSVGADDEAGQLCIHLLVVLPAAQRQGIARALLAAVLQRGPGAVFAVAAAAANAPALALYGSMGFVAYRQGTLGAKQLAMVKLRRLPGPPGPGAG